MGVHGVANIGVGWKAVYQWNCTAKKNVPCVLLTGEEDCFAVLQELEAVAHRWYDIGLALGFTDTALALVRAKAQNSSDIYELLRIMIVEWSKRTYNTNRFGAPTWRRIVDAVRAKPGGRNPSLAENLEIKYCGKTTSQCKNQP